MNTHDQDKLTDTDKRDILTEQQLRLTREVVSHQNRVLAYLFTLLTGGVLLTVTYIATKEVKGLIIWSLVTFVTGLISLGIHAAYFYYNAVGDLKKFQTDCNLYINNKLEWKSLIEKRHGSPRFHKIAECLAWLSGICLIGGTITGILAIIYNI